MGKYSDKNGQIFGGTRRKNPNWDYRSQYYGQTEAQRKASLENLKKANEAKRKKREREALKQEIYKRLKEIEAKANALEGGNDIHREGTKRNAIKAIYDFGGMQGSYETEDLPIAADSDTNLQIGVLVKEMPDWIRRAGITDLEELGKLWDEVQLMIPEDDNINKYLGDIGAIF